MKEAWCHNFENWLIGVYNKKIIKILTSFNKAYIIEFDVLAK